MKTFVFALGIMAMVAFPVRAADIWVDDDGDNGGTGSFTQPYKTITWVLANNLAAAGDVIKLKAGTYDEALGESFPLGLPDQVDLVGTEFDTNGVPLARIGGDVDSSSDVALVFVDASEVRRVGILIEGITFVGQDTSGIDAPSAVKAVARNGHDANVTVESCVVERSEMHDGGVADRAAMLFDLGYGYSTMTIQNCTIHASPRAGVEVVAGTGTSATTFTEGWVKVFGNTVLVEGAEQAEYGIRWGAEGAAWVAEGHPVIRGNVIDSTGATGSGGIGTGISVAIANTDGSVSVDHFEFEIARNNVTGCTLDGIELYNDPRENGEGHMSIWNFQRNRVSGCGRAALRIQKKDQGPDDGYINVISKSNWWVNGTIGVQLVGFGDGPILLINDTISGNADWGIQLLSVGSSVPEGPGGIINCIIWGNGGCSNCDQFDPGAADWPGANTLIEFCDFDNWSGGEGNIDVNPAFVNAANGDLHLGSSSQCIDAGDNTPENGETLTDLDIDNEDRTIDGDGDNRVHVDMGADEYDP